MPSAAFVRFWRTDLTRECFLSFATQDDLLALRLASRDTAGPVAPYLFAELKVNFNTNCFSRQARLRALESIGQHVKTFTFNMPHSPDTFLPPLIDPVTGIEQIFSYEPNVDISRPSSSSSRLSAPKYGSWGLNDLLIKQYPPLFHAATNIPSFMRAIAAMPSLRHLRISCPDQPSNQRYRKSTVDYALISIRLALERLCPQELSSLSLSNVHPGALVYRRLARSFGLTASATRVWGRFTRLNIAMMSWPFDPDIPTDHLKILHSYIQSFPSLTTLNFNWLGPTKGPSPLSLDMEPCITHPKSPIPDDCSTTKPRREPSTKAPLRPLRLKHLRSTAIRNATLDAPQASAFPLRHRRHLREFDYSDCTLRSGTWDNALEPLINRCRGSRRRLRVPVKTEEVMDVPIVFSGSEEDIGTSSAGRISMEREELVREYLWEDPEARRTLWPQALRTTREGLRKLLRRSGVGSGAG